MKRDFSALQGEFDLLVCGGGIYGAWTAYDAALRGLKVALVEQGDWAGATSSASSKLIHGGLRYLETYDFKLVRKALKERQRLLDIAPHRVWPLRFGVPVYEDSRNGKWLLEAGLTLYDALAGFPGDPMRHRHHSKREFSSNFPFLNAAGLRGGFTYGDAQTDDARLVLELVAGAMAAGAVCVSYASLADWREENGRVCGAEVRDVLSGDTLMVRAKQCVSAAGRWAISSEQGRSWCRLSKGVHLVLPGLPTQEAVLLTARRDGRVFFIIPWYGRTVLGTTDTDYQGDPGQVKVEEADIDYLLQAANEYLNQTWGREDMIGSYAGVRVMKQSGDEHPSAASRDWELRTTPNGLHHAIGGKLTSAREDAAVIVDAVCKELGVDVPCVSHERGLAWKPQYGFSAWSSDAMLRAQGLGVDADSARWLLRRHGVRVADVLDVVAQTPELAGRIVPELPFIYADLLLCARDEMVVHLSDLLRRRMPLLILAALDAEAVRRLAELVAPVLGWDAKRIADEAEACHS